jgi:hypothetical protein
LEFEINPSLSTIRRKAILVLALFPLSGENSEVKSSISFIVIVELNSDNSALRFVIPEV